LFKAVVLNNPYHTRGAGEAIATRECLAVSDKEWIIGDCRRQLTVYKDIDDDTVPTAYPTLHFGESVFPAMLGAEVSFWGHAGYTYSAAEPIVRGIDDLKCFDNYQNSFWANTFRESAEYFARHANGEFYIRHFITVDALNLAVELMGATEAYLAVYEDEELLHEIMRRGVELNDWFYRMQKDVFAGNNRSALGDDAFYELYDKPWYSVDAYTLCSPETYDKLGFGYQRDLIGKIGGGTMHTHGTGLYELLPKIVKLEELQLAQAGRDLKGDRGIPIGELGRIRELAGDLPLSVRVTAREFLEGIKTKALPVNAEYYCEVKDIDEANRLAIMAKEYHQ
ncbi:MAG: hypothetical protein FWE62_06345, partial [Firmicutes bacterium]|nr:hypothetical protein [Bacillota bacterium]